MFRVRGFLMRVLVQVNETWGSLNCENIVVLCFYPGYLYTQEKHNNHAAMWCVRKCRSRGYCWLFKTFVGSKKSSRVSPDSPHPEWGNLLSITQWHIVLSSYINGQLTYVRGIFWDILFKSIFSVFCVPIVCIWMWHFGHCDDFKGI